MAVFKCKMCGASLKHNGKSFVTCEYCDTQQTLPKLSSDRIANLYDRANHFRRINEFDKAMGIYEQILNEDATDAEAYWSLVLCRYGIEYVEDPSTHKRIPTINRTQYTSIFDDSNYRSALQYADDAQRSIYQQEARTINVIQKSFLEISHKEEPFDVFICYKETDRNGRRTPDSVLANDLYHQLTQEGFKVFFSRITLEDKLGVAYEPYIFAALNSAKVMVVLGTKPENFNAVWVKNEWSRYLAMIKSGAKKILIPAYRDMDPYDLPEEFSHLQAQDMSKLGFMQDLIRGVKKLVYESTPRGTVAGETVITNGNINASTILKRAFMFLADGEWVRATEYCEKALDLDPENAKGYIGLLMAQLKIKQINELVDCVQPFSDMDNFRKAVQFADDELKATLQKINCENIYRRAEKQCRNANIPEDYQKASDIFATISEYKDAAHKSAACKEMAETTRQRLQKESKKRKRIIGGIATAVLLSIILIVTISTAYNKYQLEKERDGIHSLLAGKTISGTYEYKCKYFRVTDKYTIFFVDDEYCNIHVYYQGEGYEGPNKDAYDRDEKKEYSNVPYTLTCNEGNVEFNWDKDIGPYHSVVPFVVTVSGGRLEMRTTFFNSHQPMTLRGFVDNSPWEMFEGFSLGDPVDDALRDRLGNEWGCITKNTINEVNGSLYTYYRNGVTIDSLCWVSSNSNGNRQSIVDTARERIIRYFEDRYGSGEDVLVPEYVIRGYGDKNVMCTATQFVTETGLVYLVGPDSPYNIYVVQVEEPY